MAGFFAVQIFALVQPHLYLLLFSLPEETDLERLLLRLVSKNVLPLFSSVNLMVSVLIFNL